MIIRERRHRGRLLRTGSWTLNRDHGNWMAMDPITQCDDCMLIWEGSSLLC